MLKRKSFILVCLLIALSACDENQNTNAPVTISFHHEVDGTPVKFNSCEYTNAAGNPYEVTEVQWFISELTFVREDGSTQSLSDGSWHYVDTNIPETLEWNLPITVTAGSYQGLRFTFGLRKLYNIPGRFKNYPEANMEWPYSLGGDFGGYHYMKFNGFWINPEQQRIPFNLHLGVGQKYDDDGKVIEYIQNDFEVVVTAKLNISASNSNTIDLVMNIESWFDTPKIFDLNEFGGKIMKNQEAMSTLCDNGHDVFSIKQK